MSIASPGSTHLPDIASCLSSRQFSTDLSPRRYDSSGRRILEKPPLEPALASGKWRNIRMSRRHFVREVANEVAISRILERASLSYRSEAEAPTMQVQIF